MIDGAYHSPQLTHAEQWRAAVRAHLAWADAERAGPMTDDAPPQASDRITLAGSDVAIPPLGVGTWAWGDKGIWGMGGYDQSLTESTIRDAWEASIEAGVVLFDTAEVYGGGESERIIGRLLAADPGVRGRVVIATKFMPSPWKVNVHAALLSAARHSLERLGCRHHRPVPDPRPHLAALARRAGRGAGGGPCRGTGEGGRGLQLLGQGDPADRRGAAQTGLRLASNQIEFSLLRAMPLRVGLLDCCRELGVVPLAYSPIGQGRLTGKYSASNPPPASGRSRPTRWSRSTPSWPNCGASGRPTRGGRRARSPWPG